jgi:predicted nucleic acid-binding protein
MIIFDSSTLILLARTDLLERFMRHMNQAIVIPKAVARESCEEKKSLDALAIQRAIQEKRITVMGIKAIKLAKHLAKDFGLGQGETEAIALASSKKAQLLATDDKRALLACRLLKIPYTTAIDILIRMSQKKILSEEETQLKLQALERYGRYKQEILLDAKSKLGVE